MKKTDSAYYAGFFDGDGYIGIARARPPGKRPVLRLQVSIHHTNIWILQSLKFAFGGSIYVDDQVTPTQNVKYLWQLECRRAAAFLEAIFPFLKLKRAEAELGLKFQRAKRWGGYPPSSSDKQRTLEEAQFILMKSYKMRNQVKDTPKTKTKEE